MFKRHWKPGETVSYRIGTLNYWGVVVDRSGLGDSYRIARYGNPDKVVTVSSKKIKPYKEVS